jgi:hypothetical protein
VFEGCIENHVKRFRFGATKRKERSVCEESDKPLIRYLLGELSSREQDEFEDRYFADSALHEQLLAVEDELIDAYVRGDLSAQRLDHFEYWFLRSAERREKLKFAKALTRHRLEEPQIEQLADTRSRSEGSTPRSIAWASPSGTTPETKVPPTLSKRVARPSAWSVRTFLNTRRPARLEGEVETWSVEKSKNKKKSMGLPRKTTGQTASIFAFLAVAGLLVAALMLPRGTTMYPPAMSSDPGVKPGILDRAENAISEVIRNGASVGLHQDFHGGLGGWTTLAVHNTPDDPSDSISAPDISKLGSLRLWTSTVTLRNYQMEFQVHMEKKSLSWAFRASDQNNYYAAKLMITKPGPSPNASLMHYVMMNGREYDPVMLPIPVMLERGVNYRIRVSVQDSVFVTYLGGQVIGKWSDGRLRRGGVGFFVDDQDLQQVAWVSVFERDSLLGRMLAHLSLFVFPSGLDPE